MVRLPGPEWRGCCPAHAHRAEVVSRLERGHPTVLAREVREQLSLDCLGDADNALLRDRRHLLAVRSLGCAELKFHHWVPLAVNAQPFENIDAVEPARRVGRSAAQ